MTELSEVDNQRVEKIIESLEHGVTIQEACEGVQRSTVWFWKLRRDNEDVKEQYEAMLCSRIFTLENVAYEVAKTGNATMIKYLLNQWYPQRYRNEIKHDNMENQEQKTIPKLYIGVSPNDWTDTRKENIKELKKHGLEKHIPEYYYEDNDPTEGN